MANQHFGKISEVWKHGVLAEVLDAEKPRRFAETHAGSADYPLTHSSERDYGVIRFLKVSEVDETLRDCAYRRVLRGLPTLDGVPKQCPGSPLVAMTILAGRADYLFFDTDEGSIESIHASARERGLRDRVHATVADGVSGVVDASMATPGACVHVDPFDPFSPTVPSGPSPVEAARTIAAGGATLLYWYGVEEHPMWAWDAIATATPNVPWWIGELRYAEPETDSGITGCGMLLGNASAVGVDRCETFGQALTTSYEGASLPSGDIGSLAFSTRSSYST